MTTTERILSCDAILSNPMAFDFGEGLGERWDIIFPDPSDWTLEQCKDWLDNRGIGLPEPNPWEMDIAALAEVLGHDSSGEDIPSKEEMRRELIEEMDDGATDGIDDWREAVRDAMQDEPDQYSPMMNYAYPLPGYRGNPTDDQAKLDKASVCLCLVSIGDETFLALQGGGVDLSWEICRSYIIMGYYPPLHFCDLPEYAGETLTERNREVLEACLESCLIASNWARRSGEKLRQLQERMISKGLTP